MSHILTDATIIADARDLSGVSNEVSIEFSRDDLDPTTFRSTGKEHRAGMVDATGSVSGFWDADTDDQLDNLGTDSVTLVIAPDAAAGTPCFVLDAKVTNISRFGAIGELNPFSFQFGNARRNGVAHGRVLFDPTTVVTVPVAGTGFQLGSVSGSITFHVHVLRADDGGEVDVDIESSATNGWTLPDVEETVAGLTGGDSASVTVTGPVTNSWWRVNVTGVDDASQLLVVVEDHA
jgi:hypothetical protein